MTAAKETTTVLFGDLEELCTCWVCFETFREPITLHCGHSFCKACLVQIYKKNPCCPFCRRPFSLPLPPASQAVQLLLLTLEESKRRANQAAELPRQPGVEQNSLFLEIPNDVLAQIFAMAGPCSIGRCAMTCRRLHDVSNDPYLWRDMCQTRWPFCGIDRHKNWKRCYAAHNNIQRGWEGGRAGDFEVTTFRGHTNFITCFQFYHASLVSASADNTLRVWNVNDPDQMQQLSGHSGAVNCVQFNEAMIASGSQDSTVRLWDTTTGINTQTLQHTGGVDCLSFDAQLLIAGGTSGQAKVWDLRTNAAITSIATGPHPVHSLCFDDTDIYTGANDGVKIWDMRGHYANRRTLTTPTTCFQAVLGDVVTGGYDGSTYTRTQHA
eukprot:TRINITY_DN848_c0_g1_i1.p1 TRINITY_DN848_c0_g1~~TRINITY_DN848_c0_g1_i1.p1  ORF type:complete len:381 (-),score=80.18 TRINITY_DN848_c0_g1_i1:50-1192(-)